MFCCSWGHSASCAPTRPHLWQLYRMTWLILLDQALRQRHHRTADRPTPTRPFELVIVEKRTRARKTPTRKVPQKERERAGTEHNHGKQRVPGNPTHSHVRRRSLLRAPMHACAFGASMGKLAAPSDGGSLQPERATRACFLSLRMRSEYGRKRVSRFRSLVRLQQRARPPPRRNATTEVGVTRGSEDDEGKDKLETIGDPEIHNPPRIHCATCRGRELRDPHR